MGPEEPVVPFLEACFPSKEAVSPGGGINAATRSDQEEGMTEEEIDGGTPEVGSACAPLSGAAPSASSSNGLGHHGEPAAPEEEGRD